MLKADVAGSLEALQDEIAKVPAGAGRDQHHPLADRRHQRVRRDAGLGLRRDHHRLQRPPAGRRPPRRRARGRRRPHLLGHLQDHRGPAQRDGGHAGGGRGRGDARRGRGQTDLQGLQGRPHRRLHRHRGQGHPRRQRAPDPRGHGRSGPASSAPCAASKTTCRRSRRGRSAASCSTATPTSRRATCSSSSRRNRSSKRWSRMPTARMRRINEVLREVVGAAIGSELSDPRIGFVTVTSVETSPDLRTAKVFVSVLGSEEEREATLAGLRSSHGVIQCEDRRRDADEAHPDPLLPLRRARSSRACGFPACSRRSLRSRERRRPAARQIEQVADELRAARALPADRPRGAGRRRARLAAGDAPPADPARQGLGDVHGGEGVPAADRVPLPAAGGGLPRAAGGHGRPHGGLPRLRQHRPDAGRLPQRRRPPHHQHRPPPRQHPLRRRQPGRHRRLLHGGDRLRAGAAARRARSPRRWPRRSTSA